MTPDNEHLHAGHVSDAYLETILALMALRTPAVREAIQASLPSEFVVASSYQRESLIISVSGMLASVEAEGMDDVQGLQRSVRQANWTLLSAMWEILKQHRRFREIEMEPVIEFFRHVRNGSSHGGRLNFKTVRAPARWRDKEITKSMKGIRVFPDLLRDGDPLLLVQDIERQFGRRGG